MSAGCWLDSQQGRSSGLREGACVTRGGKQGFPWKCVLQADTRYGPFHVSCLLWFLVACSFKIREFFSHSPRRRNMKPRFNKRTGTTFIILLIIILIMILQITLSKMQFMNNIFMRKQLKFTAFSSCFKESCYSRDSLLWILPSWFLYVFKFESCSCISPFYFILTSHL